MRWIIFVLTIIICILAFICYALLVALVADEDEEYEDEIDGEYKDE